MKKLRLALLSGGISSEREVSINSGNQVYEALDKEKYAITRYDPKTDLGKLVHDADGIDAALIILHGPYGEDGTVQGLLDLLDIPYQGSGVIGSAVAMDKLVSKRLYEKAGLPIPPYRALRKDDEIDTRTIMKDLGGSVVVKPSAAGSSVGISIVHQEENLREAVKEAFRFDSTVIVEKYLQGVEITGGVLGNDDLQALPLIEIIPSTSFDFFDYEAKYTAGATEEICPARIPGDIAEKAQNYAIAAHSALSCQGYSRTDMMVVEGEAYILETNTIPGMTATSLYPQAAAAAGMSFTAVLDRLIDLGIAAHHNKIKTHQ